MCIPIYAAASDSAPSLGVALGLEVTLGKGNTGYQLGEVLVGAATWPAGDRERKTGITVGPLCGRVFVLLGSNWEGPFPNHFPPPIIGTAIYWAHTHEAQACEGSPGWHGQRQGHSWGIWGCSSTGSSEGVGAMGWQSEETWLVPALPGFHWGPWVDHLSEPEGLGSGVPPWLAQGAKLVDHKLKCPRGQASMVRE